MKEIDEYRAQGSVALVDDGTDEGKEVSLYDLDGNTKTVLNIADESTGESTPVSVQHPFPVDGDSIYSKDVDASKSDIGDFTGDILSLFADYETEIEALGAENPKTVTIKLKRPLKSNTIGIGSQTGDFSNVKIQLKDLAGTVRTVIDDSADSTKHTSNVYSFTTNVFIEIVVEFFTADPVKISGMFIPKVQSRAISAIDGYVSETNTSQVPLLADAVFAGTQVDTLNYGMVLVAVNSDVASAVDGLLIQFRSTATSTWRTADAYTIAAGAEKTFSVQTVRRFMRIMYTNGAVDQTTFDLQTILKPVYVKPSSHRVNDPISGQDDAELVKSVLTGERPTGVFANVAVTNGDNLKISLEEFEQTFNQNPLPVTDMMLFIARGLRVGMTSDNKYGKATDGVQIVSTDIWDRADSSATQNIWLAPTAARIHTIVSSDAADDGTPEGAGVGAQAVRVWYLSDWDTTETFEDVVLNGITDVPMLNAAVMINRMKVIEVGTTYNINQGDISATAAVDATITAQINIGEGQTLMAIKGIPSIQKAYMTNYVMNAHNTGNPASPNETDFSMLINERPDLDPTVFINKSNLGTIASGTTNLNRTYMPYKEIPGPAIIKFQANAILADTEGTAEFDLIIVDN